ncbi:hypothetical protein EfmJHP36_09200 [Enterococcus faecium]|nr:hypothetical protein EfmJHP36_09200 [Enterococcus faecium]
MPTRKLPRLTSYFLGCTNPEEVKFLVTDMNAAYFQLTKRILPNAKVVIDRFHIIKHMNQAFNELRIREMNELRITLGIGNKSVTTIKAIKPKLFFTSSCFEKNK